jgi:hypothetical protein
MFSGDIRDAAGKPVPQARVSIVVDGKPMDENPVATSDEDGHYEVFESSCPCRFDFELVVTAEGFRDYRLELPGRKANRLETLDITLDHEGLETQP